MKNWDKYFTLRLLLIGIVIFCLLGLGQAYFQSMRQQKQQKELMEAKKAAEETGWEECTEASVPDSLGESTPEAGDLEGSDFEADSIGEYDPEADVSEEPAPEEEPVMLEKYRELYEANADMVGWLAVEGTKIDYPVMQCDDNEYYLHHDFYGEDSKYGCLYVKSEADLENGTNFIIYGHKMKDGSMFGTLNRYAEQEFFEKHPTFVFDTLWEERSYEVIAAFLSQVYREDEDVFKYYQFYEAESEEEFDYFYENVKELSIYDTGVTAEYGDSFLTLSTCAYHVENGRFVVVAKRKR